MPYDPGIVYDASPLGRGITGGSKALIEGWVKGREKRDKAEEEDMANNIILDFAKNTQFGGKPLINDDVESQFRTGNHNKKKGIIAGLTQKMTLLMAKQRMDNEAAQVQAEKDRVNQGWWGQDINQQQANLAYSQEERMKAKAKQEELSYMPPSPDVINDMATKGYFPYQLPDGRWDWKIDPTSKVGRTRINEAVTESGQKVPGTYTAEEPLTGQSSVFQLQKGEAAGLPPPPGEGIRVSPVTGGMEVWGRYGWEPWSETQVRGLQVMNPNLRNIPRPPGAPPTAIPTPTPTPAPTPNPYFEKAWDVITGSRAQPTATPSAEPAGSPAAQRKGQAKAQAKVYPGKTVKVGGKDVIVTKVYADNTFDWVATK